MKNILNLFLVSAFLFFFGISKAQIPSGGIIMNATSGTTFQKIGKGTLTEISISGQSFTKGLRSVVANDVSNFWDAQIQFPSVSGISVNDVILVSFYARTISSIQETGEGSVTAIIEHGVSYAKEISQKISIGSEWKQYFASVKSASSWTTSQVRYALFVGYASQTVEFADVKFINYGTTVALKDLPVTEISYSGRASDAAWRTSAADRINLIRKGKVDIVVKDQQGNILKNADVTVEMVKHKFGFGSAIPASVFLSNSTFRNKVYELFNEVVFENDLKWPQFKITSTQNISRALDSLDRHKIAVRGHNVIWPAWRWCPSSLQALSTNPPALRSEIEKRIDEVTKFTKGRLNDWDVINEPYSEHDIMDILGNEVMADWLKRVRVNDPDVKLYINDYGILSSGGIDYKKHDSYYNLIKYLDEKGAKVDGIGLQGHFSSDLTPITRIYSIIDRFAELGKDIKITEHDVSITQREVQADYTRDFMTILFSHSSVKSILIWGFWQNSHWKPDAALYNSDWSIRPHGEAWKKLVFDDWWTKSMSGTTNNEGKISFEGFLGTYKYTIKTGGKEISGTFSIDNSKQSGVQNNLELKMANYTYGSNGLNKNDLNIKIYPNPCEKYFVLETDGQKTGKSTCELYNVVGQKIYTKTLDNGMVSTKIPVSHSGLYTLIFRTENETKILKVLAN